ncbi:MAG TPA: site-2 protease family protein [Streptosporangiaceae bacterium]|jgi:membrane-associated protease RseP (regulator of RpoE activity)|nr:site-2 protease family protein [Streptosporangiaceae bacterium]
MSSFYGLLGVIAFVVALLATVVLHEFGHFVTAKRFGMKATQFFVGFGPTLWSRRRGETEYGIKAIPLGGFVRIVGYTPLERIEPGDERRAFYRQPARQRAIVIAAGVVINLVVGYLLLVAVNLTTGLPEGQNRTATVEAISRCVPASMNEPCGSGAPPAPAAQAGLRRGDRVVSFAGRPIRDWDDLRAAIRAAQPGAEVSMVVRRAGDQPPRTLRPRLAEVDGQAFLGMSPLVLAANWDRKGPVSAPVTAAGQFGGYLGQLGRIAVDLPAAIPKLFSPDRAQTPAGQVGSVYGAGDVSGQIFASNQSWRFKAFLFLSLVVSVNIFVGVLNLLPLLPMDGGHLAVLCYERIRAGIARIRGRPDPGTVDMTKLMPVTYIAVVLLVGLGVLLILADVLNPLKLPQ